MLTGAQAPASEEGPGLVLLDARGEIEEMTTAARRALAELDDLEPTASALPAAVESVAAMARRAAADPASPPARVRVRAASGRWLTLHGSALGDPPDGRAAVLVQPSAPVELAPLLVAAYGLTPRERQVMRGSCEGRELRR